jgi:hypothetical protein
MTSKSTKWWLLVSLGIIVGAYWYWSPLWAVHEMQVAAKSGDADTFNSYVDYPNLRESLKGQFSAMMARRMASEPASDSDNSFAKAGAALGSALALMMVDKLVDGFVRPEVVMQAMQRGKMTPAEDSKQERGTNKTPASTGDEPVVSTKRHGANKYIVYLSSQGEPERQRVGFVLERSGFAAWKLTEIRLPATS